MTEAIYFISNNNLASALAVAVILAIVGGAWKWIVDSRDSKKIYDFLFESKSKTDFSLRSTEAISSHTNISESRVADLCSRHPKIIRNQKEKQSWRII